MTNIFAPDPVTSPSQRNSMAGLTTALANPVIGTSVPAPAREASFWYQPSAVVTADRKIRPTDASSEASDRVYPAARNHWRSPSPTAQMQPPTAKAHTQLRPTAERGEAFFTSAAYSALFSCIVSTSFL